MSYDIAMYVGGLPFDGSTLENHSLGGSESAGLYMAKALARAGNAVKMFCNTNDISFDDDGVTYYPAQMWPKYTRNSPHDITIIQRQPELFSQRYNSKLNILWQHDLAHLRSLKTMRGAMWNIDRVFVLSEYMRNQYRKVTDLPESAFYTTRNGIDLALFDRVHAEVLVRHPKRLLYTSRPERGLDVLLGEIMPKLLEADPTIELRLAGYANEVPHLAAFNAHCRRLADKLGGAVTWLGALTKEDLYREMAQARLLVYPTPSPIMPKFAEVSCITAMEAQAAGLPIVTNDVGALRETIAPGAGFFAKDNNEFADSVLDLLGAPLAWDAASSLCRQRARDLSWDGVAADWTATFGKVLATSLNENKDRLFRHLWRQSDIVACQHMLDSGVFDHVPEEQKDEYDHMLRPFSFAFGTMEDFAAQYARIGKTHNADIFPYIQQESRFAHMVDWIKSRDDVTSVLDYGCGLGGYSAWGAQRTGKHFTGVDVDPRTIEIAQEKSKEIGVGALTKFVVGTSADLSAAEGPYDCAVLQEVLEHVTNPWGVLQSVEAKVTAGGQVYITVPFGPWEYSSYHTYPWRCHLWHFDNHDIRDMVGHKQELSVSTLYSHDSPELGDPLGWWIVTYKADHTPIGKIDLERKLRLQRPRQTVSATLICGGAAVQDTLHWCLSSLQFISDEIVIVNTGMTEEALRVARTHPVRIVNGPNPLQDGFETARNFGLDECRMDWIFWIDADERVVSPRNMHKFLRENMFMGYGIRQHHFACDTTFTPDMPVRLFRNRPHEGKRMQFFGAIHEHPELELNGGPGPIVVMSDVHIAHVGYLHEDGRQARFQRNYPLLQLDIQRYPDRLLQKHFMMRDGMVLVREALKSNGNNIDGAVRVKCQEVVELYRKHFLGKGAYMNTDSLTYYSEALAVLGEGFEVAMSFDADPVDAKNPEVQRYRFANKDDLMAEWSRRISEKVEPFDNEWY
jgi:glycosyltransferase involved in cell wall biosynthesis/SAM-dependent methyltransferase